MTKLVPLDGNSPASRSLLKQSPLAMLSLLAAMVTLLAEVANAGCGVLGAPRMVVGILIFAAMLPAALGLMLAVASLIRREDDGRMGQYGLWLNGAMVVFSTPLGLAWLLNVR